MDQTWYPCAGLVCWFDMFISTPTCVVMHSGIGWLQYSVWCSMVFCLLGQLLSAHLPEKSYTKFGGRYGSHYGFVSIKIFYQLCDLKNGYDV